MSLQVPIQRTVFQLANNTREPEIMLPKLTCEQLADSSPIDFVVSFINANLGILPVQYFNRDYLSDRLLFMKDSAMAKTNDPKLHLRLEAMVQQWTASVNRCSPSNDSYQAINKSATTTSDLRLGTSSMKRILGLGLTADMKKNLGEMLNERWTAPKKEAPALLPVNYLYKHVLKGFHRRGGRALVVSLSHIAQQKMLKIRTHLHLSPSNKRHGSHQELELVSASALSILVRLGSNSTFTQAIAQKIKNMRFPYHDGSPSHLVIQDWPNDPCENAPTFMLQLSGKRIGRLYDTLRAFFRSQGYVDEKNIVIEHYNGVVKQKAHIQPDSSPRFLWKELVRWNGENNAGKALMDLVLEVEPKYRCAICGPLKQNEDANYGGGSKAGGSHSIPEQEITEATLAAFESYLDNRLASLDRAMVQVTKSQEVRLGMTFISKHGVISIPLNADAAILGLFLCSDEWVEIDDFVHDRRVNNVLETVDKAGSSAN